MTYRDQIEFKIRKLTRAIDAIGDLPTLPHPGHKFLGKLKTERADLRRAIATGRASCGECGHPMRPTGRNASSIQTTPMGLFLCETTVCSAYGAPVLVRLDN